MPDPEQLPWLLELLDDMSPVTRGALRREFAAWGEALPEILEGLEKPPGPEKMLQISAVLAEHHREWLRAVWPGWYGIEDEIERLEAAMALLAEFQNSLTLWHIERTARYGRSLCEQLDHLADEFIRWREAPAARGTVLRPAALDLAEFLFVEKGFTGDREHYYHPENSNLYHVLRTRRGRPLSLALVYMLTGRRVGLAIYGCNWPGHFYAQTEIEGGLYLVDAFNGICMDKKTFLSMQGPSSTAAERVLHHRMEAESIVIRVLHNLSRAWQEAEDWANNELMTGLLRHLKSHIRERHTKKRP
jgi:hypothetical protein